MEVFLAGCPSSRNIGVIANNGNLFSRFLFSSILSNRLVCGRKEGNAIIFSGGGVG